MCRCGVVRSARRHPSPRRARRGPRPSLSFRDVRRGLEDEVVRIQRTRAHPASARRASRCTSPGRGWRRGRSGGSPPPHCRAAGWRGTAHFEAGTFDAAGEDLRTAWHLLRDAGWPAWAARSAANLATVLDAMRWDEATRPRPLRPPPLVCCAATARRTILPTRWPTRRISERERHDLEAAEALLLEARAVASRTLMPRGEAAPGALRPRWRPDWATQSGGSARRPRRAHQ